ncbi:MAG: InlB B-repeat-containing protein [Chitinispirillaceae bacterium]|nr:InlB B-repeat-containing protein [Chitinispirillaceae bacterium]
MNSFALVILATNGTVKKTPDLPQYDSGYTVGLKATPAAGFTFANWSGDAAGTADSTTIVMSAVKNITANFVPLTYQLTASAGIGGTITAPASSPVAVNHAAATTITATPNSGYRFSGWTVTSGTATFGDTSSASTLVTLSSGNATVTANFTRITYQFTVTSETGGTISTPSSPATVNHGVATTITATPGAGYSFNGWVVVSGSATIPDLTSATTIATLTSGNAEIKAQWTTIPYSIIYTLNGGEQNGGSYPAIYSVNTSTITLANPTKTAYVFDGWYDNSGLSGNRMATIPQGSTGNKTLYAKWSIKDIDGNYYTEVKIGNQYWMVENLKTSKYNDGELIPHLRAYDWKNADLEAPKWCWHADNSGYKKYGGLYTYNVAGNEKIAPDGWRVADSADFENARSFIEENYSTFTPFLAGLRGADGVDTFFNEKQYWWIGKEMMGPSGSQLCFMWGPAFDSDEIILSLFSLHRFTGASIRCVRDE